MKLYFVADGHDGDNYDLIVRAESVNDAVKYWRDYYQHEDDALPDKLYEIPAGEAPGALPWHAAGGLKLVATNGL